MTRLTSRQFAVGAALFLGAAMAVLSYDHALIVAREVGTQPRLAYVVPLLPDGMFVLSSAALYDAAQGAMVRSRWAMAGLALGGGVTLAMNIASGWPHGWGGCLVNAMPPVFLIVAIEILIGIFRRGSRASDVPTAEPPPLEVALAGLVDTYSQRSVAAALDVPRPRLAKLLATVNGNGSEPNEALNGT